MDDKEFFNSEIRINFRTHRQDGYTDEDYKKVVHDIYKKVCWHILDEASEEGGKLGEIVMLYSVVDGHPFITVVDKPTLFAEFQDKKENTNNG